MDQLHQKKAELEQLLRSYGRVAVAFSGGVDSTFLLKVAHDALGANAVALTAQPRSFPQREREAAAAFCRTEGVEQIVVAFDELTVPGFRDNPPNRCYLCKRALFTQMLAAARDHGFSAVCEGSNLDDLGDYRPGLKALEELNVKSPLRAVGLTKAEIRALSKELGLPTWDKPSMACLSTRFVYGETITAEKLRMVEQAEQLLLDLGLRQVRVRVHGSLARIEVDPAAFPRLIRPETRARVNEQLERLGFSYVTLDLGGYVTGSMNKGI